MTTFFNLKPKTKVEFILSEHFNVRMKGTVLNDPKNGKIWIQTKEGTRCISKRNLVAIYK